MTGEPERPGALAVMRLIGSAGQVLTLRPLRRAIRRAAGHPAWPVHPGGYVIGDPSSSVAVCTLSDAALAEGAAALPGVAIAGRLYTANLGIERIIGNVTANPSIRFLLLCGRDSPLFHPGDAVLALAANGTDAQQRILGTAGYMPRLAGVPAAAVESFRRQVEVVDRRGETSLDGLRTLVAELAGRDPGPFTAPGHAAGADKAAPTGGFTEIRPGGRRRDPLGYDPAGYFVISLDRQNAKLVAEHYRADHTPAHRMRGNGAETILAGYCATSWSPSPATSATSAPSWPRRRRRCGSASATNRTNPFARPVTPGTKAVAPAGLHDRYGRARACLSCKQPLVGGLVVAGQSPAQDARCPGRREVLPEGRADLPDHRRGRQEADPGMLIRRSRADRNGCIIASILASRSAIVFSR
jgi:tetrahydromethanopterin S-methyltransferase subunit A